MQPNQRPTGPTIPTRQYLQPQDTSRTPMIADERQTEAAASIVRENIARIYTDDPNATMPTTPVTPVEPTTPADPEPVTLDDLRATQQPTGVYDRTHQPVEQVSEDAWKQYHTAWQSYYQQYYHRAYTGKLYEVAQQAHAEKVAAAELPEPAGSSTLSRAEAVSDLRSELVSKLRTGAARARKSRHFIPIAAAFSVMLLFVFLQYNQVIFANVAAYVSPGSIDPANIITQPNGSLAVDPAPRLIIPKIVVDVPVIWDTTPDYNAQMKAMENGVAWFGINGANSKPGQVGNTVLSGHSSNDWLETGSYKFIFARLDQLIVGDMIYVNYEGTRYSYTVTNKEIVLPTEVSKLVYTTDKPVLTLITCTPLGTSQKRLLVTAEQVSPAPGSAIAAPTTSTSSTSSMPGSAPTFFERLFGAK